MVWYLQVNEEVKIHLRASSEIITGPLFSNFWKKLLWNNELLKNNFHKTYKCLQFFEHIPKDKNPTKLMKYKENGKFVRWIEVEDGRNRKVTNSFVCYKLNDLLLPGKITSINNTQSITIVVQKLEIHRLFMNESFHDCFIYEELPDEYVTICPSTVLYFFSVLTYENRKFLFPVK